jgi:hypothetical protein
MTWDHPRIRLYLTALAALGLAALLAQRWRKPDSTSGGNAPRPPSPARDDGPPERPDQVGVRALLSEMVDLVRLTRLPDPPYTAHLASSYDRRSLSPDDPQGWFANEDWASRTNPNYVRVDETSGRREYVLLDVQGPGAVVRIWSATPTGTLRLYVDGDPVPVLEESMADLLSGRAVIPPPFAYVAALGYNAYFPFPYRKSVKVTVDDLVATDPLRGGPLEKFYYQINYRTYSGPTADRVRSFRRSDLTRAAPEIARVGAMLNRAAATYQPSSDRQLAQLASTGKHAERTIERAGGGVIRELVLRPRDTTAAGLRGASLTITFDDELAVRAPLGDFFGAGPGLASYDSLPFEVRADGTFISRWPMPFRERARIVVHGQAGLGGQVSVEPLEWSDRSLYFHAKWRPRATVPTRPLRDLRFVAIEGQGLYVGNALNVTNPPGAMWWGEGDDKVYVDQERFPSEFGTGTEDYYGYAWSTTERFARPFHAQTRAGSPGFDGDFSMNRFHILDAIPFSRAFRFEMELWHWQETSVTWDAMAYYYARPGAKDDVPPLDPGGAGAP